MILVERAKAAPATTGYGFQGCSVLDGSNSSAIKLNPTDLQAFLARREQDFSRRELEARLFCAAADFLRQGAAARIDEDDDLADSAIRKALDLLEMECVP